MDHLIRGTHMYEVVGYSRELPNNVLPTNADIIRALYYLREEGASVKKPKLKQVSEVLQSLADLLIACWILDKCFNPSDQ